MDTAWAQFGTTVWQIVSESAPWVIVSLVVGGLVREFLPSSRARTLLNGRGHGATLGAILFGALLPICSCGVIPLAISLYRSGVRIGPVMAFAAATPIINPAAVILSLALLGPQITMAYVVLGLVLPYLLGLVAQRWGEPAAAPPAAPVACCSAEQPLESVAATANSEPAVWARVAAGLRWGIADLGPTIAFYMAIGILLAGLIAALLPPAWVDTYLRESSGTALMAAALLGASIYVCAVGHIPLVATLLASGAAPGISIVFLVTGTATNLPELIALYNTIGRRVVILYAAALLLGAMIAGVAVNAWLMPGFEPVFDPLRSLELLETGQSLQPTFGWLLSLPAALVLVILAGVGSWRWASVRLRRRSTSGSGDSCCSG